MDKYVLYQNGKLVMKDDEEGIMIREKIEEMLEEKIGFFVMLQESTDDDKYEFYLHTDNEKDISDEDWEIMTEHYGINVYNDEQSELSIKKLLNIEIQEVALMNNECVVGRPINGISLNGLEYLLEENNDVMVFKNEESATEFLKSHGCNEDEMDSFVFEPYSEHQLKITELSSIK